MNNPNITETPQTPAGVCSSDLLERRPFAREEVWLRAWCVTATAVNCYSPDAATRWADACLKDFSERFKAL